MKIEELRSRITPLTKKEKYYAKFMKNVATRSLNLT